MSGMDLARQVRTERSGLFDVDREWRMTWCGDWTPGRVLTRRLIPIPTRFALAALPMFQGMIAAAARIEQEISRLEAALSRSCNEMSDFQQRVLLGPDQVFWDGSWQPVGYLDLDQPSGLTYDAAVARIWDLSDIPRPHFGQFTVNPAASDEIARRQIARRQIEDPASYDDWTYEVSDEPGPDAARWTPDMAKDTLAAVDAVLERAEGSP